MKALRNPELIMKLARPATLLIVGLMALALGGTGASAAALERAGSEVGGAGAGCFVSAKGTCCARNAFSCIRKDDGVCSAGFQPSGPKARLDFRQASARSASCSATSNSPRWAAFRACARSCRTISCDDGRDFELREITFESGCTTSPAQAQVRTCLLLLAWANTGADDASNESPQANHTAARAPRAQRQTAGTGKRPVRF